MLTPSAVANAKPKAKQYKLFDERGMYLLVKPEGGRLWRFDYRRPAIGKRNTLALGSFPDVSLKRAREKRDEARALLADGVDPGEQRKATAAATSDTFEAIAREWMNRQEVADITASKNRWLLETFLFPNIGARQIADITPRELLTVLRKIEESGKRETANRAKMKAGQIFRFAILEGKAELDPTASLRGAMKSSTVKHHAAITDPAKIGKLLRAIDGFTGSPITHAALQLAPLVFVRPGELRKAVWEEFDLDGAIWRIPAARMKMRAAHLIPLSTQAVAILRDLMPLTGAQISKADVPHYVFPSIRTRERPMSENTVNGALRGLGYGNDEMTGHGFRSMAATRLNEMGWNPDAIERQLAHAESNKVRDAYTSAAQYLDERKRMMQAWANYLDGLRSNAVVVPLKRRAR